MVVVTQEKAYDEGDTQRSRIPIHRLVSLGWFSWKVASDFSYEEWLHNH